MNVGEVAGHLVAFCRDRSTRPIQVHQDHRLLADFQAELDRAGVERHWPRVGGY
jgi:hypothetical protein